jgi:hypothetical protein
MVGLMSREFKNIKERMGFLSDRLHLETHGLEVIWLVMIQPNSINNNLLNLIPNLKKYFNKIINKKTLNNSNNNNPNNNNNYIINININMSNSALDVPKI